MGCATARQGERLETTVSKADEHMMAAKREFYAGAGVERRATLPGGLA
jgi:hypothetical protein